MELKITFKADRLIDALGNVPQALDKEMRTAVILASNVIQSAARVNLDQRTKRRSGLLVQSILAQSPTGSFSSGDLEAKITAGDGTARMRYALFVEEGTEPHDNIKPKSRKVLRWATDGKQYGPKARGSFFKFHPGPIEHPGTEPVRYMFDAIKDNRDKVEALLADGLKRGIKKAGF